jgi:peptidoglycan/LPS O-acetylase OafA/YrhL
MEVVEEMPAAEHRLPSLDGLRAISILMVILGHLSGTHRFITIDLGIGNYAQLGVRVFFVISGFLITSLLMGEQAAHGRISLKLFYLRRALRILPASYTYLILLCILCMLGTISVPRLDMICAFTYTMNYLPGHAWQVGHLWSLSVEEQFYLLWPFAFSVLKTRKGAWAAIAAMILAMFARSGARLFLVGTPYRDLPMFPMVADSLATGCLLAISRPWLESRSWYLRLIRTLPSVITAALILLLNRLTGYTVLGVLGTSIINIGIALLIHRSVLCYEDLWGRFLNWRPVVFIGVLSYSIYVWQQLFLNRASSSWMNVFPQNLVLAAGAALGSYFMIEKPLLGLRGRLRTRSICQTEQQVSAHIDLHPSPTEALSCKIAEACEPSVLRIRLQQPDEQRGSPESEDNNSPSLQGRKVGPVGL